MGPIQRGHSPAVFSFHTFIYTLWVVLLEVLCWGAWGACDPDRVSCCHACSFPF